MQAVSYISQKSPYTLFMPQGRPTSQQRSQLGERIAQARLQAGLTQKQLAQRLGTTQRVITYWEREAVGLRAEQLAQLSEALGVSADFFLGRSHSSRPNGPSGKARFVFEQVNKLPRSQQQRILATVEDMLIAQKAKCGG
jgi:transcriptional regulator with XRE-family HTH domain